MNSSLGAICAVCVVFQMKVVSRYNPNEYTANGPDLVTKVFYILLTSGSRQYHMIYLVDQDNIIRIYLKMFLNSTYTGQ